MLISKEAYTKKTAPSKPALSYKHVKKIDAANSCLTYETIVDTTLTTARYLITK